MRKWLRVLEVLFILLLGIGMTMVIRQELAYRKGAADYAEAEALAKGHIQPTSPSQESAKPDSTAGTSANPDTDSNPEAEALAGVTLDALREVNSDVVGWIEIPGTELSYPLMQGVDNQHYLSYTWKNTANSGGSIFLDYTNSPDFSDFHTIIYGHRMRNDSMFGTLKYYKNVSFWQKHPSIYIVWDGGVYRYDIFAAYEAGVTEIVYQKGLSGRETELIQFALDNSQLHTGVTPSAEDRILTLSTCTGSGHAKRWVVQAVLAEEYGEPSSVQPLS